jgi:hypothetical protein
MRFIGGTPQEVLSGKQQWHDASEFGCETIGKFSSFEFIG